ncbi:MAG: glycosyltransferase [Clostridia bacterium]|nr:glycosyltransferase [Clostridia bacterium]
MKIAIICDVLGEENNGTTIAAMNLIRSLKAKGHSVRVVCPDEKYSSVPGFYVVPQRSFGPLDGYLEKNGVTLAKPDADIIRSAIKGADVAHIMLPFSVGKAAIRIAKEEGVPVTAGFHFQAENLTAHLKLQHFDLLNDAVYHSRWNAFYKYVDCIHYPTQFIRDVFEKSVGQKTEGRVISNGVAKAFTENGAAREKRVGGKFTVICTGRYSREKRQELLIEAATLSKYKDDIKLVFAGDGPLKDKLIRLAEEKKVDAEFKFFSREELLGALRSADLYVHTAEIEIEAIACLEAIASGLVPVIANSPRSATRYYALDEKNLFDYDSPSSLAERMDFWRENPAEAEKNRAAYADFTREIDYDACMDKMEEMLKEVAENAKERAKTEAEAAGGEV